MSESESELSVATEASLVKAGVNPGLAEQVRAILDAEKIASQEGALPERTPEQQALVTEAWRQMKRHSRQKE